VIAKNLFLILTISILSACVKPVEVITTEIKKPALSISLPAPIEMRAVRFYVITENNYKSVFNRVDGIMLIGMNDKSYKNLSLNMSDIRKYIIELNKINESYKRYYEEK